MTVKRHFVEYTTTEGTVYAIGTKVDYQASNGDWEAGYVIGDMYTKVGGHETSTKWASIHKCQDAFDAPIGRLRLKVDEPVSREINGRQDRLTVDKQTRIVLIIILCSVGAMVAGTMMTLSGYF